MTSSTKPTRAAIVHAAPKYRLSVLAREPGGLSDAEMIQRATAGVELLHTPTLEALDMELERLAALVAGGELDHVAIYNVAVRINEIAAVVGYKAVGLAAFSLCNLLEGRDKITASEKLAVALHLETIKLLRSDNGEKSERTLLPALRNLVAKLQSERAG